MYNNNVKHSIENESKLYTLKKNTIEIRCVLTASLALELIMYVNINWKQLP